MIIRIFSNIKKRYLTNEEIPKLLSSNKKGFYITRDYRRLPLFEEDGMEVANYIVQTREKYNSYYATIDSE